MNGRCKLGAVVVASVIVLFAGQVALAQVEWTYQQAVVGPGDPGSWDSYRHIVGDVVFDGTTYHMYLLGGQTSSPWDSPWHVGHWTWNALTQNWDRDPDNPVLSPEPGSWDGFTIYGVAVLYRDGVFKMWYGAAAAFPGVNEVGYAESTDGSSWTKLAGPLVGLEPGLPGEWDDAGVVPGTVFFDATGYQMWYHGVRAVGTYGTYRIGYATSSDGLEWSALDGPVLVPDEPWATDCVHFPEVVPMSGGYAMWYSGIVWGVSVQVGYAVSPDGVHWGRWPANPVLTGIDDVRVIVAGDTVHGWVSDVSDGWVWYVTSPLEVVFFDDFETGTTDAWSSVMP